MSTLCVKSLFYVQKLSSDTKSSSEVGIVTFLCQYIIMIIMGLRVRE